MKVKIEKASYPGLWYESHIGKEVEVIREDDEYYWVNELDVYPFINIIIKEDAKLSFKEALNRAISNLFC